MKTAAVRTARLSGERAPRSARTARRFAAVLFACGAVTCGAPSRSHLMSPAQAQSVRVYVNPRPVFVASDDDCKLHYGVLGVSLPHAVRRALTDNGFTVVREPSEPRHAEAVISGDFSYCKKSGTCVNGVAEVSLVVNGAVVERHRFDTGQELCSSAPTVDEFPDQLVEQIGTSLLDSERVFALSQGAPIAPVAAPPGGPPSGPAPVGPQQGPAAVASASAPAPASFIQGAPQPNAFALVVGIENYRDVPPPKGARADAIAFSRLAQRTLGLPEAHVRVLLDGHATRGDLEKGLAWLELNVPAGGRVFFFYSGHGAPDPVSGTAYILPYDGDPAALAQTAMPVSQLTERLAKTKAADSVAFLDACFSGAGGRSVLPKGARPLVMVQTPAISRGVSVLSSSSASEISGATADGTNGLFSKYLMQALGEAQGDLDGDLQISLSELKDWIEPRVSRAARLENRVQTPTLALPDGRPANAVIVAFGVKR